VSPQESIEWVIDHTADRLLPILIGYLDVASREESIKESFGAARGT
jgi:hypothetical protein